MISADEKYNKKYAYEFIDREVKTPMTFKATDNGNGTITLTAVPTQVIQEGTPLNATVFMAMQEQLLDLVFPIGRGFIDFTETDYSNYLGFTWERELMGMFPLGADDTTIKIGNTGGSKTKTISKNNLPNYNLSITDNGHSHTVNAITGTLESNGSPLSGASYDAGINQNITTNKSKTGITVNSGGGNIPLDIMPPFKAVYYWKRVA